MQISRWIRWMGSWLGWSTTATSSSGKSPSSACSSPYSESDPLHFKRASIHCQDELLVCFIGPCPMDWWCLCVWTGSNDGKSYYMGLISSRCWCGAEFSLLVAVVAGIVLLLVHELCDCLTCLSLACCLNQIFEYVNLLLMFEPDKCPTHLKYDVPESN